MAAAAGWADLPLDMLDEVIARLPIPGDRARLAAVCRAWRSAAREVVSHLPWIVLPYGTACTAGHGAACSAFRIPGFPDDTTCLGAAYDCWLALDRTDDVVRRTPFRDTGRFVRGEWEEVVYSRPDVNHKHVYALHNPFSNVTVPLPDLDAVIGHVAETFRVLKVLMRSPAPDDLIAVTTNSWNCNVILCRPGKGTCVLPYYRVVDVAFLGGDTLYGITSGEELIAFHLGEDDIPDVTKIELVIKNPLACYYYECGWVWPEEVLVDYTSNEEDDYYYTDEEEEEDPEDINEEEAADDEPADQQALEDSFNGDEMVSDNEVLGAKDKDLLLTGRYLVQSLSGELLLVRHHRRACPHCLGRTCNLEVFKADFSAGKWVAAGLAKDEAIFLSRSHSKCARARRGIRQGFVYYTTRIKDVFDTTSSTVRAITVGWPRLCVAEKSGWFFPPELVV
jgi:hypothetical protein